MSDRVEVKEGVIEISTVYAMSETEFALQRNFADADGAVNFNDMMRNIEPKRLPALMKTTIAMTTQLPMSLPHDKYVIAVGLSPDWKELADNVFLGYVHMKIA